MKLIIEIPEELKNKIDDANEDNYKTYIWWFETTLYCAIKNGTPIPDNATNGEIMQMMFPNGVTAKFATFMRFVVGEDEYINCAYDWWNAPYQKGGTTRKNCEYRHENGNCLKVGGFCTSVDDEHCVKGGKE